jgi:hypothetical protein
MRRGLRRRIATLLVLAGVLLPGCTLEQILIGQWYTVVTPPSAGCPRLEWQFVVDAQRSIEGFLFRDRQHRIATLSGRLGGDDSFQIVAREVAGIRTATVTGIFTSQVSTISIQGDAAGSGCNGLTFKLRLGNYFLEQGGGGGGGGG